MHWQVQEAKQRFSEVVRAAEAGEPQVVTRHGHEVAVVIDIGEYRRLSGAHADLMTHLRSEPFVEDDLVIERARELPREVDLAG
ncbi:prevent-host-death family protein [Krasilnikovia cinnamomea]|uniref:Antitoxin n=1 Tax=Krasilnikovia cinnamomea TaxID=349313 RepID=A0A4Q7ZLK4_9ACTN|nr:type II toxin-antitoxin system Phd/YefM family antitoxin [Krasilnikovia cinnamomea]RZU51484.1 prevent-host-death family protein [Krasilnikovia cinnamomea]